MNQPRKIIHVDMDAFYASVEQLDNPEYRGKPVIVGGPANGRGVVAASSYEARAFGVRSAMSSRQAGKLCPNGIFVAPRFERYKEISRQVMELFYEYTDLVEPLSLDEAYLDVTEPKGEPRFAREIAQEIRAEIKKRTGLTASAGVAPNKFLAKIASDLNKPDGLTVVPPERVEELLRDLPVRKLPGVGRVTENTLLELKIETVLQLREWEERALVERFGKFGAWLFQVARGVDPRSVNPSRERKSVGCEDTFSEDLLDIDRLIDELYTLSEKLYSRLRRANLAGRTLTLKVTYSDFQKITRSFSSEKRLNMQEELFSRACELFSKVEAGKRAIRLLGLSCSGFDDLDLHEPPKVERAGPEQLSFDFSDCFR